MKQWTLLELQRMANDAIYKIARDHLRIPGAAGMGDDELRSAVIAYAQKEGRLIEGSAPEASNARKEAIATAPPPQGVHASYPPHADFFPQLVGRSVADALASLRDPWSMGDALRVYVNGDEVPPERRASTLLKKGDRMECQRPAGEKGA